MKKILALTFVTFAIAALVTSVVSIGTAQTANAVAPANNAYGKEQISGTAATGNLGGFVSSCAHGNPCAGSLTSSHGIADFRADGDKFQGGYDSQNQGQGQDFRP